MFSRTRQRTLSPVHSSMLMRKSGLIAAVAVTFALACCGCDGWSVPANAKEMKNPVPSNAATLDSARILYQSDCAKCHGVNGDGKRPPGSMYAYSAQPTNFTDAKLVDSMSDGEIFWKITNGRKPMPSFEVRLTDNQRWALVNLIRAFAHPASAPARK